MPGVTGRSASLRRTGRRDPALAQVLDGLCRAIVAFYRGEAADALELLGPIRGELWRLGGSWAQRDVFEQLTIEAALKANPQIDGRALLARREVLRPNSRLVKTAGAH